ncbi:MAG: superoxide dismutase family protein [Gemmatimonadales bacterium]
MDAARISSTRAALLGFVLLSGCGGRPPGPGANPLPKPAATAKLTDTSGKQIGLAIFTVTDTGTTVGISIAGLAPGLHGLHIHEVGRCAPPDFASAGGHFNPTARHHGLKNPEGPHLGDLPNLLVQADGSADTSFSLDPRLLRPGPLSLLDSAGTALVVHADRDDQRSDPSGGSGARIACGMIAPG